MTLPPDSPVLQTALDRGVLNVCTEGSSQVQIRLCRLSAATYKGTARLTYDTDPTKTSTSMIVTRTLH
jgi:hypothetical protein